MNIGIFSTLDQLGGAARAANRLHTGLLEKNIDSYFYAQIGDSDLKNLYTPSTYWSKIIAKICPSLDLLPLKMYKKRENKAFSAGLFASNVNRNSLNKLDVINMHWINNGFQSIKSIAKIKKPLVLSLHDSWSFTGGCHIPATCDKYVNGCGNCPQLNSNTQYDLSRYLWKRKFKYLGNKKIAIAGDSSWIIEKAKSSPIFSNASFHIINPGLRLDLFRPLNKSYCRSLLGLDENEIVISFGAFSATKDLNKGFHLLAEALNLLVSTTLVDKNYTFLVFGATSSSLSVDKSLNIKYLGNLKDDLSLAITYSASDLVVVPSIQETFGQTASESLACGTPVVAFNTSGLKDVVDHMENGYLAAPYDIKDLAKGITWVLEKQKWGNYLNINARKKAEVNFGMDLYVEKYIEVYENLLQ